MLVDHEDRHYLRGIGRSGSTISLRLLVAFDGIVDLATVYRHFLGSFNSQTHLVTANFNDNNRDVIVDDDALVLFP